MISDLSVTPASGPAPGGSGKSTQTDVEDPSAQAKEPRKELTADEAKRLEELQARDREVRAHEQAHLSAAGGLAQGGATFTYERGPDQRLYAVGGEVQVDTSVVAGDPVATLRKAQTIRRAALAPVEPSAQDRAAAAEATQMAAEARAQITSDSAEGDTANSAGQAQTQSSAEQSDATTSCPSCGGAHASHAHEGITAYAAEQRPADMHTAGVLATRV